MWMKLVSYVDEVGREGLLWLLWQTAGGLNETKPGGAGGVAGEKSKKAEQTKAAHSVEVCEEWATGVLPASCVQQLDSANWKDRLAAMKEFLTVSVVSEIISLTRVPCRAVYR